MFAPLRHGTPGSESALAGMRGMHRMKYVSVALNSHHALAYVTTAYVYNARQKDHLAFLFLQGLARLPRLSCLDLSGCNHLTGAALAPIGTVTCLQTLKLQHCLRCKCLPPPLSQPLSRQ